MATDDFFWRFGDGRMCADGSASLKSYDPDWLRTNFIVQKFASIGGLSQIYEDLPWIERLLVDYTSFPGPYDQYDFSDAENVALDEYAIEKGIDYEDIKVLNLAQIDLYRFEKDGIDLEEIEGEEGYFRGSLTSPGDYELGAGTSKPYTIIRDTGSYPLTFAMDFPTDLPALEEGYTREYIVLDLHCTSGGSFGESETCEAIELPMTFLADGTKYSVTTTKFSSFALAYYDTEAPAPAPTPEEPEEPEDIETPDTGYLTVFVTDTTAPKSASSSAIFASIAAVIVAILVSVKTYRTLRK